MQEFMLLFRHNPGEMDHSSPKTDEEQAEMMKPWNDWIGGIAAQGKFISSHPLQKTGTVIKGDGSMTDGPYTELKEIMGGYLMLKADSFDEAVEVAKECPVFSMPGATVEVRETIDLGL